MGAALIASAFVLFPVTGSFRDAFQVYDTALPGLGLGRLKNDARVKSRETSRIRF